MKIGLVGRGQAARTLVPLMESTDLVLEWWWSRRDTRMVSQLERVDVALLAVPDDQIKVAAISLASRPFAADEVWLHLSGSAPGDLARVAPATPLAVGSLHPLQALPGHTVHAEHLQGVLAGIEGEPAACAQAVQVAERLGMVPKLLKTGSKPLYHAGAVMAAGHVTAAFAAGLEMLEACGLSREEARGALFPLIRGAVANLQAREPAEVITGPVARGDIGTLRVHLEALKEQNAAWPDLYRTLALAALEVSSARLDPRVIDELRALLSGD